MKKNRLINKEKEECSKLTHKLEELLNLLGWNIRKWTRETARICDDEDTLYESRKKDLQRGRKGTINPDKIQAYINEILRHEDYKKLLNHIVPSPDDFDKEKDKNFIKEIIGICKNFSKQ